MYTFNFKMWQLIYYLLTDFQSQLQDDITVTEIDWLMKQPNTSYERLPPILDCIIGMDIIVTQNINKLDHVVHGTIGKLYSIIYQKNTTFTIFHDKTSDVKVNIPNKKPLYLLIQFEKPYHEPCDSLSVNVYPIGKFFLCYKNL